MKLAEIFLRLNVGDVIEFDDGEILLIGHASLSRQPTDNDGGVGWDDTYLEKEVSKIRPVDFEEVLLRAWYDV